MTKIVPKSLPHAVSNADIADQVLRQKVMLLQENIKSIASQLSEAQKALVEVQGGESKSGSVDVQSLAVQVAPIVASTVYAKTAEASGYASDASISASASAESALESAASASSAATVAETTARSTATSVVTQALSGILIVDTFELSVTVNVPSDYYGTGTGLDKSAFSTGEYSVHKEGYNAIGVVGVETSSQYFIVEECYLKTSAPGDEKVAYKIKNLRYATTSNSKITVHIMYAKTGILGE